MRPNVLIAAAGLLALAAGAAAPPTPFPQAAWRVAPFAGDGVAGDRDGPKDTARFHWPTDVAVAPDWTAYVADFGNDRIRKVGSDGRVSTLAGGPQGFADGNGAEARFNGPNAVALGPDGALYVADAGNARIRRVTPEGAVTTIAGDGVRGVVDGPGPRARFVYPTGLAFDPEGNLYVVDRWAHTVRKVDPEGEVTTLAGRTTPGFTDGPGPVARFNNPLSAAWDPEWGLVVTDSGNSAVRRVAPEGTVTTLVGGPFPGGADGPKETARFAWNTGIESDGRGGLYIADTQNHKVRRITLGLYVTTVAGSGDEGVLDGPDRIARFAFITGLTLDPAGNLIVADSGANRLRRVSRGGGGRVERALPALWAAEGPPPRLN
jgi:sugar lactone lactonase YvrE